MKKILFCSGIVLVLVSLSLLFVIPIYSICQPPLALVLCVIGSFLFLIAEGISKDLRKEALIR